MTDLLYGHDDLYSVETVQAKIVVEVRFGVELQSSVSIGTISCGSRLQVPLRRPGPVSASAMAPFLRRVPITLSKFLRRSIILPRTSGCERPALAA